MTPGETFRPATVQELGEIISARMADGGRLSIRGGGSKDGIGKPDTGAATLDMGAFSGIIDYDPPELVMTVGAATPLIEIEQALAQRNQMLAFEPVDLAPLFGGRAGRATIGGVIGAGFSGSQRLTQGAVRDHLLGFTAVSGRGQRFVAGAKVVKNVTGYDLSKLMCGSWGRLAALTEVTLKVLPRPSTSATMVARGLSVEEAWLTLAKLLGSQVEIAAAAHISAGCVDERAITVIRLQGFEPSVAARCQMVEAMADTIAFEQVSGDVAASIWSALATLAPLGLADPLWRISLPARSAPALIAALQPGDGRWMMDWAGSLIWMAGGMDADRIRAAASRLGGHAMLMRASPDLRSHIPALQPPSIPVAALEERVRRAFDPAGIFETGRF